MEENSQFTYWKEYSENDMKVAGILLKEGQKRGFAYQACVFHCHQAIEKMIKAILISQGKFPPKIHDLSALCEKIEKDIPGDIQTMIDEINPHYLRPRYPDLPFVPAFHFTYNKKNTEQIFNQTKNIFLWLKQILKKQ